MPEQHSTNPLCDVEVWVSVNGDFTGYCYQISNRGRVRSGRIGWRCGRILKPFADKNGYLRVNLFSGPRQSRQVPIHVLVAEAFLGSRPSGMTVNHRDHCKENNSPENLEWKTTQENTRLAKEAGMMKRSTLKRLMSRERNRIRKG